MRYMFSLASKNSYYYFSMYRLLKSIAEQRLNKVYVPNTCNIENYNRRGSIGQNSQATFSSKFSNFDENLNGI